MREIKFRAWDDVEGEMLYCGEDTDIVFTLEDRGQGISCTDIRHGDPQLDTHLPHMEHLKYMQFTGVYDDKGAKVFEGDVVSTGNDSPELEVIFEEGAFFAKEMYGRLQLWHLNDLWFEVIGNIHEQEG